MKTQAYGTVKKNKISSSGKPKKLIPTKYVGLKDQTFSFTKSKSHIKNTIPVMSIAGKINLMSSSATDLKP